MIERQAASRRRLGWIAIGLWIIAPTTATAETQPPLREGWPKRCLLATAGAGSTYFTLGAGMAHRMSEQLQLPVSAETTDGSAQNAALVQNRDMDVGFMALPLAWDAWRGRSKLAPGLRHERLRALFPLYATPLILAVNPQQRAAQLADLAGKSVGLGAQGGPADSYWSLAFQALNIQVQPQFGARPTQQQQWQQKTLNALGLTLYATQLEELNSSWADETVQWLTPSPSERERLVQGQLFSPWSLAPGLLTPKQPALMTIAVWHFAVARADLPNDLVYAWLQVMATDPQILALQPTISTLDQAAILENRAFPYHPGAARFYSEKGFTLPPDWGAL